MSYDLFFRLRPQKSISYDEFAQYFHDRRHYELNGSQAWYSNEDTGVYFVFEYSNASEQSDEEDEGDPSLLPVTFNLNYFRPHPFGLEAEPEVAAFVEEFGLTVSDPQMSGMGDGEYSREGFLRGWNGGNAFGYHGVLRSNPASQCFTLPSARIEPAWRWNIDRARRQNSVGEDAFVPRIMFFAVGSEPKTGVVWPDGIPIVLPLVDIVLVP